METQFDLGKHLEAWESTGQPETFVSQCKRVRELAEAVFGESAQIVDDAHSSQHQQLLEITYDVFDFLQSSNSATTFWKLLVASRAEPTLSSKAGEKLSNLISDTLAVLNSIYAEDSDKTRFQYIIDTLKSALKNNLMESKTVVQKFPIPTSALVLGYTEASMNKVYSVTVTKHTFLQQKFNLFREESEGYSKLIAFLLESNFPSEDCINSTVTALIGSFFLDPTRVLDIIIQFLGFHLDNLFLSESSPSRNQFDSFVSPFVKYLKTRPSVHIYSIISFYINELQKKHAEIKETSSTATESTGPETTPILPLSFSRTLAMIINYGFFTLEDILILFKFSSLPDDKTDINRLFCDDARFALLASLLEVPQNPQDIHHLDESNQVYPLFNFLLDYKPFRHKRLAFALCQSVLSMMAPVSSSFLPSQRFNRSGAVVPTFQQTINTFSSVLPYLRILGEQVALSSRLWNHLCALLGALLDAIQPPANQTSIIPTSVETVAESDLVELYAKIEDAILFVLLPSFVSMQSNGDALWSLLRRYPYTSRFKFYYKWKSLMLSSEYPHMNQLATQTKQKLRGMMKRITDDSVKEIGRPLCNAANPYPIVLADILINLNYSNFVQPLADCMRYLNHLSLDVLLSLCLENAAKSGDHSELSNLATFLASLFKLYYDKMDIEPLLDVIEQLLKRFRLTGATLFTNLLSKMGCVDIVEETLTKQLKMVHSFGSLQKLALSGALQRKEASRSSIVPLRDRLWTSNSWLPLYILVSQLENHLTFYYDSEDHFVISNNLDMVHQLSLQISEFVAHIFRKYQTSINPSLLQSVGELSKQYQISYQAILHLYRPILHLVYQDVAALVGSSDADQEGHLKLSSNKQTRLLTLSNDFQDAVNNLGRTSLSFPLPTQLHEKLLQPTQAMIDDESTQKRDVSSLQNVTAISSKFLAVFWSLGLMDIECDQQIYKEAIAKQQSQTQAKRTESEHSASSDISPSLIDKDMSSHMDHVNGVMERLKALADTNEWFIDLSETGIAQDKTTAQKLVAISIIQHCLLPRTLHSAEDAIYCSKFVWVLHKLNPVGWNTEIFLDCFFELVPLVLSSSTVYEVSRYGRLVCGVLETILSWREYKEWRNNANIDELMSSTAAEISDSSQMEVDEKTNLDDNAGTTVLENVDLQQEAHHKYCLKSLTWERSLLDSVVAAVSNPLERWTCRVTLFFLKELGQSFPSCERFCAVLRHGLTQMKPNKETNALVMSYQNLLETRMKNAGSHEDFCKKYPGYTFPPLPAKPKPQMKAVAKEYVPSHLAKPAPPPTKSTPAPAPQPSKTSDVSKKDEPAKATSASSTTTSTSTTEASQQKQPTQTSRRTESPRPQMRDHRDDRRNDRDHNRNWDSRDNRSRSGDRDSYRDRDQSWRQSEESDSRKRKQRSGSPEPPPEKRQKTGESSTVRKSSSSNTPSNEAKKEEVIGPPLPPKSSSSRQRQEIGRGSRSGRW